MKWIHLLFIHLSDMLHISYTTSKVGTIGENPTMVQFTSGEIDLRCAYLGVTPIGWQSLNLWRLPKRSIKTKNPKSCQEKLLVISDF
jgi:hypothetical protein